MKKYIAALIVLALLLLACIAPPWIANTSVPTATVTAKTLPTVTPTPLPTVSKAWTATVKLPTVNVRDEPDGIVIGTLTVGKKVTVLECVGNWCKIEKPAGWIWRGCLSDNPGRLGCAAK